MAVRDVHQDFYIPLVWPRLTMDLKRVDAIAIHHTVTFFLKPSATVAEERAHISMIHVYHKSKGWGGFAYHLISFPSGRVYLVVPLTQWGAHVRAENDHLEAIVVAGDFTSVVPTKAQQQGVVEGIRLVYATLGRAVSIRPHRSWTQTACPGDTWRQWVPGLTALVEEDDDMLTDDDKDWFLTEMAGLSRGAVQAVGTGEMSTGMRRGDPDWRPPMTLKDLLDKLAAVERTVNALQAGSGLTEEETIEAVKRAGREGTA